MSAPASLLIRKAKPHSRASRSRSRSHPAPPAPLPILHDYYHALFQVHGPQHWWPARTRFEIIVGAILVQNTNWSNVERAILALRHNRLLTPTAIERVPLAKLASLVRSAGYFRQKARKLKAFVHFLRTAYSGSLPRMFYASTSVLREQLLTVHGIGPETADCILLYAGSHPVFVVDGYTRRILERHQLIRPRSSYEQIRALFEQSLPNRVSLFNEYHALLVEVGKRFCKKSLAFCSECPLQPFLPAPSSTPSSSNSLPEVANTPALTPEVNP